ELFCDRRSVKGRFVYGSTQAGPPNALTPLNIGGMPLGPAIRAVRSLIAIMFMNRPRPGTRSQRELKAGLPGLVSSRRVGARKLVRSVIVTLSVLFGMPADTKSDGQEGLGLGVVPRPQAPSELVAMLNDPSEKE